MTRRIRDFMTNTNTGDLSAHDLQHNDSSNSNTLDLYNMNRNFGVPLDKCESSSISPVSSQLTS